MKSDQELIDLINKGDLNAFETLYYRYRDWVYHLGWRFTGKEDLALDVLQETFIYLLNKFPGFKLTARMTTFLYPVVKHTSLVIRSRESRKISDDESLTKVTAYIPEEVIDSHSELATVLAALPEQQREVLLMRYVDDMSTQEIAAALNIPVGTVKSRLHHALQKLRQDNRAKEYFLE